MFPDDAPCHGKHDLFFPANSDDRHRFDEALVICGTCPYHAECRQAWEELRDPLSQAWGVWFGTAPNQRRRNARMCLDCPTMIPPRDGSGGRPVRCPACRARHRQAQKRESRIRTNLAERQRDDKRRQRAERLGRGLCADCGKHLHRAGRKTCIHCAAINRAKKKGAA